MGNMYLLNSLVVWIYCSIVIFNFFRFLFFSVSALACWSGLYLVVLFLKHMKSTGMFAARILSFQGANFEVMECSLEDLLKQKYDLSVKWWTKALVSFDKMKMVLEEREMMTPAETNKIYNLFWGAHQRFFLQMVLAMKVRIFPFKRFF